MLGKGQRPPAARPLQKAGLYWPADGPDAGRCAGAGGGWPGGAAGLLPRLMLGGGLDPVNRLIRALMREGLAPLPVFVASLKRPVQRDLLQALLAEAPPAVIVNLTSFAVGTPDGGGGSNPLRPGCETARPCCRRCWRASRRKLGGRHAGADRDRHRHERGLAEVDGRLLTRAVGFKEEAWFDTDTQCRIIGWRGAQDGSPLSRGWRPAGRGCGQSPGRPQGGDHPANYPTATDGGKWRGLDTPAATVKALHLLAREGYGVADAPQDTGALMDRLLAGPTNWLTDRADRTGGERLPFPTISAGSRACHGMRNRRWLTAGRGRGRPVPGRRRLCPVAASVRNVVVGLQPARGYNIDPAETYHAPDLVPPHNYLAFYQWLRDWGWMRSSTWASTATWNGCGQGSGAVRYLLARDRAGAGAAHLPVHRERSGRGTQAKRRAAAVILDHLTPPLTRAESYGPLRDLEVLVDEFYQAQAVGRAACGGAERADTGAGAGDRDCRPMPG